MNWESFISPLLTPRDSWQSEKSFKYKMNNREGQRVSRIFYPLFVGFQSINWTAEVVSKQLLLNLLHTYLTHQFWKRIRFKSKWLVHGWSYSPTFRRSIDVRAMTLANKFSRCFSVSNIRRQPLMTWKLVNATIFSFYFHLQEKKLKLQKEQEQEQEQEQELMKPLLLLLLAGCMHNCQLSLIAIVVIRCLHCTPF